MSQIVVVNRVPAGLTPLGEWLAEVADQVTLLTSAKAAGGYEGSLGRVVAVEEYSDGTEMPMALDELCRTVQVERIVHVTEEDVLRAAKARDAHGIAGLSYADALPFRDKLVMKEQVARSGDVAVPAFAAVQSRDEAVRFGDEHGWPIVVKPRLGYASTNVRLVRSAEELTDDLPPSFMAEEYIPGAVYHVDGVFADGKIVYSCPSRYVNTCLSFQDSVPLGSVQLDPDDPRAIALMSFAESVAAALPPGDRAPFHLEVMEHETSGRLYFCEIACRLGGGHIPQALTLRTGINPARAWIRHQAGLPDPGDGPIELSELLYGFLLVPPRAGTLTEIAEVDVPSYVREYHVNASAPQEFSGASASTDSLVGFVVEGSTARQVEERLEECARLAEAILIWG
jgi:hypothetical protein